MHMVRGPADVAMMLGPQRANKCGGGGGGGCFELVFFTSNISTYIGQWFGSPRTICAECVCAKNRLSMCCVCVCVDVEYIFV